MRSNVPPICTPRRLVFAAPVTERKSVGASGFGSNVSICDGPPASQSQTIEVCLANVPERTACSRARKRPGRDRAPRPNVPTRRKSRREVFAPCGPSWDASIVSMAVGLLKVSDSEDASQVGGKHTKHSGQSYQGQRKRRAQFAQMGSQVPIRSRVARKRVISIFK